ncbi:MAG: UbiA family prenyltransferase [bacterium]|jgi:4-hydroxybenzoate polyprenyltransferase
MSGPEATAEVPLVVDLDGTLLRTDLLHESTLVLLRSDPLSVLKLPGWLAVGKAHLKREIAQRVALDFAGMPYHEELVEWLRSERACGRRLVLATASDEKLAQAVAAHLPLFDEVLASDGRTNNASDRKAAALVERYGERGFDYVGNSSADLAVWERARRAVLVSAPASIRRAAAQRAEVDREFGAAPAGMKAWVKALRLHQWLKNVLLFLPLLGSHQILDGGLLTKACIAFLAFGLCASSVYVLNDLMDLESDRHHPRKRLRPFAAGVLSPLSGIAVAGLLLLASFAIAAWVAPAFLAWLGVYFGITLAYTFWLKRKEIVDALSLAGLYTLRIIAGGAAVGIAASFWLLAFSLFLFLSLALVKRCSEFQVMLAQGRAEATGRGYRPEDLPLIQTLGVVAGFAAVLVLALYINGESVALLYSRPQMMWLTVPILLYWITRVWIKTHRGLMHDDPVLFALKDRVSILCGAMFLAVMWAAK